MVESIYVSKFIPGSCLLRTNISCINRFTRCRTGSIAITLSNSIYFRSRVPSSNSSPGAIIDSSKPKGYCGGNKCFLKSCSSVASRFNCNYYIQSFMMDFISCTYTQIRIWIWRIDWIRTRGGTPPRNALSKSRLLLNQCLGGLCKSLIETKQKRENATLLSQLKGFPTQHFANAEPSEPSKFRFFLTFLNLSQQMTGKGAHKYSDSKRTHMLLHT